MTRASVGGVFDRWQPIGKPGTAQLGARTQIGPNTGRQSRFQEMMDVINRRTGQRGTDIRGAAQSRSEAISSKLGRIGMGNTTVGNTLQAGVGRDMQAELRREADAQQGARLGVLSQRTGFIEAETARREEADRRAETARIQAKAQIEATKISASPAMARENRARSLLKSFGMNVTNAPGIGSGGSPFG